MSYKKPLRSLAMIPARAGSLRVPDKNVRLLNEHPLLAYTIAAALNSRVFSTVVVSTDSEYYADIARYYGADVPGLRPPSLATSTSPDLGWVGHTLQTLKSIGRDYDCFSILRPTSPFRLPSTIQRAWHQFTNSVGIDSLRAVEKCSQHPGKMWVVRGNRMLPLLPLSPANNAWHNNQFQVLPEVFVQNASLEMAWARVVDQGSIAGHTIMPFLTKEHEGQDINHEKDWWYVNHLIEQGRAHLPKIYLRPYHDIYPHVEQGVTSH